MAMPSFWLSRCTSFVSKDDGGSTAPTSRTGYPNYYLSGRHINIGKHRTTLCETPSTSSFKADHFRLHRQSQEVNPSAISANSISWSHLRPLQDDDGATSGQVDLLPSKDKEASQEGQESQAFHTVGTAINRGNPLLSERLHLGNSNPCQLSSKCYAKRWKRTTAKSYLPKLPIQSRRRPLPGSRPLWVIFRSTLPSCPATTGDLPLPSERRNGRSQQDPGVGGHKAQQCQGAPSSGVWSQTFRPEVGLEAQGGADQDGQHDINVFYQQDGWQFSVFAGSQRDSNNSLWVDL